MIVSRPSALAADRSLTARSKVASLAAKLL